MLKTCNVTEFKNNKSDYNFIIVRSPLYNVEGTIIFTALAPSEELFLATLENKKSDKNWYSTFKKKFLEEINTPIFMEHIHMIAELLDEGLDVTLMCYCKDVTECHRTLVAEKFAELGYEVDIK